MAAVDKCYISSYKLYKDFCDWAKGKSFTTPRGEKIMISNWIYDWEEEDLDGVNELPIFNTPIVIDNYLYHNCPLQFIQEWIKESYFVSGYRKGNPEDVTSDMSIPVYEPCTKVKIVKKGPANHPFRVHNRYTNRVIEPRWISVRTKGDDDYEHMWWWNDGTNSFARDDEFELWTSNNAYFNGITIKSIIRKILKVWKLPKGCIIDIHGRYVGDDWVLETK